ncbi:MAG TPA: hypothetical protein VI755_11645 [Anaerolineales bacterium]|nr:hypothetical protein [Anaerolineales bacterium]
MIVSFPSLLMEFQILIELPKGTPAACGHLVAGHKVEIVAPIQMKIDDYILVDLQTRKVEEIRRRGIVIWRAACVN